MDLSYTAEQELFRDSVKTFVEREYEFESRQKAVQAGDTTAHWSTFVELGWLALPYAEEHGGLGFGAEETSILMEEFGRGLVLEPYFPTALFFGRLIALLGSEEQRSQILSPLMEGNIQGAVAFSERQSRFDITDVETTCIRSENKYILNGQKAVVLNGKQADYLIVSARTADARDGQGGISLFVTRSNLPGIERSSFTLMDGQQVSHMTFKDVVLDQGDLLGSLDCGEKPLQSVIDQCTLELASEAYGIMDCLLQTTVEFVKTREQFGANVGSFQSIQHRLVDVFIACEDVKSLIIRTLCERGGEKATKMNIHALKYKVAECGKLVWEEAIQMHGAMGMTDDLAVSHYAKRLIMLSTIFGDEDFHLDCFLEQQRLS